MKLTNIFEQEKEILEEGLRFGRREMKLVDLEAKDIIVGVEYEYHVNEEYGGDEEARDEEVYERGYELQREYIEEAKEKWIDEYVDYEMNESNAESITANLASLKKTFNENYTVFQDLLNNSASLERVWDEDNYYNGVFGFNEIDDLKIFVDFVTALNKLRKEIHAINSDAQAIDVDDMYERIYYYLNGAPDPNDWDDFKEKTDRLDDYADKYEDQLESIISSVQTENLDLFPTELANSLKETIVNMMDDFESEDIRDTIDGIDTELELIIGMKGTDSDWDSNIREGFKEGADDLWESDRESYLGFDPDDGLADRFHEEASEEILHTGMDAEATISEMLRDSSNRWDIDWYHEIEDVTTDSSVSNGVETISKPLQLHAALELMEKMFEHIKEIGSTSDSTGMHVNMSIRGLPFTRDHFNPTKLAMLMNERYLRQETKFPIRQYVGSMFDAFGTTTMITLAQEYVDKKIDGMIEMFEEIVVPVSTKYQLINFSNITEFTSVSNRRIEFRFFGGNGYERRFDEMKMDIYRTAYMLMASYSDEFGKKEYFNEILDFLDKESEKLYRMSFVEFAKIIKSLDTDNMNDIERELAEILGSKFGRSEKIKKKVLQQQGLTGGALYQALNER